MAIRACVTTVPMGKVATMAQNLVVRALTPVQRLKVVQQAAERETRKQGDEERRLPRPLWTPRGASCGRAR